MRSLCYLSILNTVQCFFHRNDWEMIPNFRRFSASSVSICRLDRIFNWTIFEWMFLRSLASFLISIFCCWTLHNICLLFRCWIGQFYVMNFSVRCTASRQLNFSLHHHTRFDLRQQYHCLYLFSAREHLSTFICFHLATNCINCLTFYIIQGYSGINRWSVSTGLIS